MWDAEKARNKADKYKLTYKKVLKQINNSIQDLAEKGKYAFIFAYNGAERRNIKIMKKVVKKLTKLGYVAADTFDASVGTCISISWKD